MDGTLSPVESALSSVSSGSPGGLKEQETQGGGDCKARQHTQAPSTATNSDEKAPSTQNSSKNGSPMLNGAIQPQNPQGEADQHFPLQLPSTLHGTKAPQGAPSRPNLNPKELRSYIANMKVVQVLQLTSELILVWQSLNSDANALKDGTLFSAMNQRVQSCLAYLSVPMRERAHSDSLQAPMLEPPFSPTNLPAGVAHEAAQKLLMAFARVRQSFAQADQLEKQLKVQSGVNSSAQPSMPAAASSTHKPSQPQAESQLQTGGQQNGQKRERESDAGQAATPFHAPTPTSNLPFARPSEPEAKRRRSSASPGTAHPHSAPTPQSGRPPSALGSRSMSTTGASANMNMPSSSAPQMPFASQQNMFAQAAPPRVPSQPHMSGPLGTYAGATSQPMSAPGPLPQMPVSAAAAQPSPQPQSFAGGMPPPQPTGRPTRPPSSMGRAGMAPPRSGMMNAGPMPPQMMHQLQQIQQLQAQINHFNNTLNHPSHQSFPQSYRQTVQQQRDAFQHQLAQAAATFKEMQKHFAPQMQQTQRMPPSAPGQQAMPPAGMRPPSRVGGTPAPQPNGVPYRGPTPSAMPQHMMQHQQQPAIGSSPQMSPNAAAAPFFPPQMQPPQMQSQMQPQIQSQMQPQMQSQLPMRSGSMSMSTGPPTMNAASPAQYASTPQNAPTPYSGAPTPQQQMSASASSPAVAMQQLPRSSFSHPGHPTQSIPPQQPMDSMQIYQRMQRDINQNPATASLPPQQQQQIIQRNLMMMQQHDHMQQLQHQQAQQQAQARSQQSPPIPAQHMPPPPQQQPQQYPIPQQQQRGAQPPLQPQMQQQPQNTSQPQPLTTNPAQLAAMLQQQQSQSQQRPPSAQNNIDPFSGGLFGTSNPSPAVDPTAAFTTLPNDQPSHTPASFGFDLDASAAAPPTASSNNAAAEEFNWEDFITGDT